MKSRQTFKKILIWLLTAGIFVMAVMRIGYQDTLQLKDMEPVNPFEDAGPPVVELSQIHRERTLKVALEGRLEEMNLEDYVAGVLAAEMPATFSPEALKAQAVAARTLAIYKIMHGGCSKYKGADICGDSSHCQAFLSVEGQKEKWKEKFDTYFIKLRQAVTDTAGKIITYGDKPILVLFHASSAGFTEDVENVYSQAVPYLRSVPSPGESAVTTLESQEEFDRKWFASTVNNAFPKAGLRENTLDRQVAVTTRYSSGRVKELRLGGDTITGVQFRRLIGIRSTNFSISFNQHSVIIKTEGYGHGVGMSQNGAEAMAREGYNYTDILKYYYTGVSIAEME